MADVFSVVAMFIMFREVMQLRRSRASWPTVPVFSYIDVVAVQACPAESKVTHMCMGGAGAGGGGGHSYHAADVSAARSAQVQAAR